MDETQGFLYLGHSNWTICSLLSWFCFKIFPSSWSLYWRVQFLITPERERGRKEAAGAENGENGFTQKWMRHRGFCTWGIQTGPFAACWADFVPKFFHQPDLYTGESNSSLPQREENEKKGFTQKWMRHRGFCTWGIQTGPIAACYADFVQKYFHHPDLYTGESNSLLPQSWIWEKGIHPKIEKTWGPGFCTWGFQTGPFAAC